MFVSAAVSEIHELNQNKKKKKEKEKNYSEIGYFQLNIFPGNIIYPFLNQRHIYTLNLLEVPYTTN